MEKEKSNNRSVMLSFAACCFAAVCIVAVGVFAPWLFKRFFEYRGIDENGRLVKTVLIAYYPSAVLGILALSSLIKILKRIQNGTPFCMANVYSLKNIYICCFAVAVITFTAGLFYIPFLFVFGVAAFLGVILRVVKNLMQSAVEIREENDLTV